MINTSEIYACLARKGMSKADGAKAVGVTPKTFYNWMEKKSMPTDKAEILIDVLGISDPANIFFANKVLDK